MVVGQVLVLPYWHFPGNSLQPLEKGAAQRSARESVSGQCAPPPQTHPGPGQAVGLDGAPGGALVTAAEKSRQTLNASQVLRELLEVPLLLNELHVRRGGLVGQALAVGH